MHAPLCSPELQWRQCTRKVRYASRTRAESEAIRLWLGGTGAYLHVYLCDLVLPLHWHVGHTGYAP